MKTKLIGLTLTAFALTACQNAQPLMTRALSAAPQYNRMAAPQRQGNPQSPNAIALRAQFDGIDSNRDEALSFAEVASQKLFAEMSPEQRKYTASMWMMLKDKNQDQKITWAEFHEGTYGEGKTPNPDLIPNAPR